MWYWKRWATRLVLLAALLGAAVLHDAGAALVLPGHEGADNGVLARLEDLLVVALCRVGSGSQLGPVDLWRVRSNPQT